MHQSHVKTSMNSLQLHVGQLMSPKQLRLGKDGCVTTVATKLLPTSAMKKQAERSKAAKHPHVHQKYLALEYGWLNLNVTVTIYLDGRYMYPSALPRCMRKH
jgi:hypothetical protein